MSRELTFSRVSAGAGSQARTRSATLVPGAALRACDWRSFDTRAGINAWDRLAKNATEPNPFYESWHLLPSLRALDDGHQRLHLLVLEADGELVGLLPLARENGYYGHLVPHWRNWLHPNCFLGAPLVARGFETAFWRALLDWCDGHAGAALFLHLAQIPHGGSLRRALDCVLARQHRAAATVKREERALLTSSLSPEEYLEATLSTKKRKELRRQHRRLTEAGELLVEQSTDHAGTAQWARAFLDLEARGWKGKTGSAMACDPAKRAIFTQALTGAAARGRLHRLALRLDGKPIAMLASFLSPPGGFSYKTAFDESYAQFSPGVLLQREALGLLEREGIAWVDSCAAENHPMIDHFWRDRRAVACHSIAIGGLMRRAAFAMLSRIETGHRAGGLA